MRVVDFNRLFGSAIDYQLAFKTRSSKANWCFHRFRLFGLTQNADGSTPGTFVQARKADGTIIDTQLFRSANYSWGQAYEHSFLFDLSFNTAKDEIEIYIGGVGDGKFDQLYAVYAHAGSAVRWAEDPAASGMSNAELSYINFAFMKFSNGYPSTTASIVYIENQSSPMTVAGPNQFHGHRLDIRNNGVSSAEIDQIIIGCDTQGRSNAYLSYEGNSDPTNASRAAYDNLINRGWTITGNAPPII
jgi:hypothetical protein